MTRSHREEDRVKAAEASCGLEADHAQEIGRGRRAEEELSELAARGRSGRRPFACICGRRGRPPEASRDSRHRPAGDDQTGCPCRSCPSSTPRAADRHPSTPRTLDCAIRRPGAASEISPRGYCPGLQPTIPCSSATTKRTSSASRSWSRSARHPGAPGADRRQMVITSLNALEQIGVQWGGAAAGNYGRQTMSPGVSGDARGRPGLVPST